MKVKVVTLSDVIQGNKRLCLSAERALGLCWQCNSYDGCESRIVNAEYNKPQATKKQAQYEFDWCMAIVEDKERGL